MKQIPIEEFIHICFIRKTLSDIGRCLVRDFVKKREEEDGKINFTDPNPKSISLLSPM